MVVSKMEVNAMKWDMLMKTIEVLSTNPFTYSIFKTISNITSVIDNTVKERFEKEGVEIEE